MAGAAAPPSSVPIGPPTSPGSPSRIRSLIVPPAAEYRGARLDGLAEMERHASAMALVPGAPQGSNSWALGGSRTASGRPLVAGDPHRALDVPNVYYQNHLACPDWDAIGLSFPGVPGLPHFGHTARVAWCVTHGMADYQDLYIERFDASDPSRYEFRGEWREADVRQERIEVRGGAPVEIETVATHHGPVVVGEPRHGHALACAYSAIDRGQQHLRRPRAHAARAERGRARRGDARVGRARQQLRHSPTSTATSAIARAAACRAARWPMPGCPCRAGRASTSGAA